MIRTVVKLSLLALCLSGSGCAYFQHNPVLDPISKTEFVNNDLPVPEKFELDRKASWRHERSTYRRLKLVYRREGYLSEERVAEFVKTAFPTHGWETVFQYGLENYKFVFAKGAEECRVEILEDFGDRFTEFHVIVEPRTTPDGDMVGREDYETASAR
jgi:hypothetical protein